MCAAKKQSLSGWERFRGWVAGPGRPSLLILLVVVVAIVGLYLAWLKLKPRILASEEYRIGPEQIEITPPPGWVHADIRAEVFRDPKLDGSLSLLDDDLTERIAKAFGRHPWVAKVGTVTKQFASPQLRVPLAYRQPVCMVEVAGGLLPVDVEGIVLPTDDFTPNEAARYPRVVKIDRKPTGPVGSHWGDARVVGAAEIAAAFGPTWQSLDLKVIEPLEADPSQAIQPGRRPTEPFFVLYTSNHSKILWGYAPGAKTAGETTAEQKVAWLKKYANDYDSLDAPGHKPQQLDARTLGQLLRKQ